MSRFGFKWSDTGSYIMIAVATSVFVATHMPHRAPAVQDSTRSGALTREVGTHGDTPLNANTQRCMRSGGIRNGVFSADASTTGPCLMVHWTPGVPAGHKRFSGMV